MDSAGTQGEHYLRKELYEKIRTDPLFFEFLQEGSLDGIWYWDLQNPENEWLSPRYKELMGYTDQEIPNSPQWWQTHINKDDLSIWLKRYEAHQRGEIPFVEGIVRYPHKNGTTVWVNCRGIIIRDDHGRPVRMLGAHTDVTALKEAEEVIRRQAEDLRKVNVERTEALARSESLLDIAFGAMPASHGEPIADAGPAAIVHQQRRQRDAGAPVSADAFKETLHVFARQARVAVGAHQAAVSYIPDGDFGAAYHTHSFSKKYERYNQFDAMPTGAGIWGLVVETKSPIRMTQDELLAHPRWRNFSGAQDSRGLDHPPMQGWLAVPFLSSDSDFVGIVQLSDKYEGDFTESDQALLMQLAQLMAPAFSLEYANASLLKANHELQRVNDLLQQRTEELQVAAAKYQDLYDRLPNMAAAFDAATGCLVECNQTLADTLGFSKEELIGRSVEDLHAPDCLNELRRAIGLFFEQGEVRDVELRLNRRDGGEIDVSLNAAADRDRKGTIVRSRAVWRDITEHKRATMMKERLAAIVTSSNDAIIGISLDGIIESWNPAAERLYGYAAEEAIGKSIGTIVPPDRHHEWKNFLERIRQAKQVRNFETVRLRKDGSSLDVSLTISPILDASGAACGAAAIARDITGRKLIEAEREALIDQLEDKNTELERFTYTVSHDLKSPLVTIQGFLGLLKNSALEGDWDRLDSDTARISNAAARMKQLLDELLELSRIGRVETPPAAAGFGDLARQAAELCAGAGAERSISIEIADDLPTVRGDCVRLVEVLQNLIENAIKFTGPSPNPRVEIGAAREGDEPVFFVRDNGIGIDPVYHERIFNVFEQLNKQIEGSGIGLALTKRIIEVHGGRIWVESEGAGKGSTFCFTLPDKAPTATPTGTNQ